MVAKAEIEEIRDILSPPAEVVEEKTEAVDDTPDETTEEELAASEGDETLETDESETVAETDDSAGEEQTYTPAELAAAVGWETDDIYNSVVIPLDEDGGNPIPLGEFKNKYQDMAREVTSLQTQLTEATTGLEQAQSGVQQGQQLSQAMIQQMGYLEQVNKAEENTNWAELEELDPTDAVLQRDKIRRARDEVMGNINTLQAQEGQQQQEYVKQATQKMYEMIPEWKDEAVKKQDQDVIRSLMHTGGFQDNEINSIIDPRTMKLLKRLSYLEGKEKQASGALKKVRGAPKALKGRKVEAASNQDKVDGLVTKAKQTGDKRDAHKAISALLAQG